jgi:Holliday junction resolvase RusA-like endonuclease
MVVLMLPKVELPRINDKFNKNFSLKQTYRSKKENLVRRLIDDNKGLEKVKPPYQVEIEIGTHYDIDSCIKPLLDSMQDAELIDNDKNILKMIIEKEKVKRNEDNWIIVTLIHYEKRKGMR